MSTHQAAAPVEGRGSMDDTTLASAGSLAGRLAGLLSAEGAALVPALEELAQGPFPLTRAEAGSMPHRFQTAILSKSSDVSVDAFLMRRCFFLRSFRACVFAADTCFCASFIALRAAAMCSSMSMGALRLRLVEGCGVASCGGLGAAAPAGAVAAASSSAGVATAPSWCTSSPSSEACSNGSLRASLLPSSDIIQKRPEGSKGAQGSVSASAHDPKRNKCTTAF